jgi:amidase
MTTVSSELPDLTATEQRALLASGQTSARELLDAHLARIEKVNPVVNAIVALDPEVGRRRALAVDEARARGDEVGPLAGLVTAHKDLAETADFPTTFGSPVFADNRPKADSLLVSRMKAAGAMAVGKTNTPEFGRGSHTFNPVYGTTLNPYDLTRTCGGSSGGAAVSLATGMVAIADGSDMGGSLRNPAGWNNVVGFRASPGVVPAVGPGPPHPRLATEGAMGRTVDDLALLLGVLSEQTPQDPVSRGLDLPASIDPIDRPLRVAWSPTLGGLPVESEVLAVLETVPPVLEQLGWEVVEAQPDFSGAQEAFATLRGWMNATGQAVRLGSRMTQLKETIQNEAAVGAQVTAQEVADALNHVRVVWGRGATFFESYDLLLGPVSQVAPFPIEVEYPTSVAGQEMGSYIEWMMSCCYVTVMGSPALSLPSGFTAGGLPTGVQIIGGHWQDLTVLRAAKTLEMATGHGLVRPPLLGI